MTQTIPQGAIWVKNFKLRQSVSNFISTRSMECPACKCHFQADLSEPEEEELNETLVNHIMTVKVKALREKFIAIYNPRQSLSTHPSYFLYVYQAYTGASSVYPFASSSTNEATGTVASTQRQNNSLETPNISTTIHDRGKKDIRDIS